MGNQLKIRERFEFLINKGVNDIEKLIKMTGASRRTALRLKSGVKGFIEKKGREGFRS